MKYTDRQAVRTAFENIINDGRKARKAPLMKLGEHTEPSTALEHMSDADIASLDILGAYKGISTNSLRC